MTEEEFIEAVIGDASTPEDIFFNLASARGFLLERDAGKLFCSDNGARKDSEYLAKILGDCEIGSIVDTGRRNSVSRIREPEILINHPENLPQLGHALFAGEAPISDEMIFRLQSWRQFRGMRYAPKVEVQYLEPYVARYVKALNACGIRTESSCDGHHAQRKALFVLTQQDMMFAWHKFLWENYLQRIFPEIPWDADFTTIRLRRGGFRNYYLLNQAAAYLYERRIVLRDIRYQAAHPIMYSQYRVNPEAAFQRFLDNADAMIKEQKVFEIRT